MWSQVKIEMGFSLQAVDILVAVSGKLLPEYFFLSSLCSASFLLMKRNDVISTSNPHFLDLRWLHLGQSDLCVHLK